MRPQGTRSAALRRSSNENHAVISPVDPVVVSTADQLITRLNTGSRVRHDNKYGNSKLPEHTLESQRRILTAL